MKLFLIFLLVCCVITVAILLRSYYECRHFKTYHYDIADETIPEAFDGFRFVVLADLHNYDFGNHNEQLIDEIKDNKPDIVIIAGDMIEARPEADMQEGMLFVKKICESFQVYFAYGNHEQRIGLYPEVYGDMNEIWEKTMCHQNLHFLRNDVLYLEKGESKIGLFGLELDKLYYKRIKKYSMDINYLCEILGKTKDSCYNILIAHNPLYFDEYAQWGADLVLSGHFHGGMVILPFIGGVISPQMRLFPKYSAGEYAIGSSRMILSRGLHMHTIPLRLFNMPEISCVTLHHKKHLVNGE